MNLRPLANPSLLVVAATYGFLLTLAAYAGMFGIWLGLLVLLSLWRYCYSVLRHVAQGRDAIPAPELETMNPIGEFAVAGHFAVIAVLLGAWFTLTDWLATGLSGSVLRWGGTLLLVAAFPASAALLGLTRVLSYALNPLNIAGVVRTLRADYPLLLAACTVLLVLSELLQRLLLQESGVLTVLVGDMLFVWGALAVFALIGGAVHQHRDDFYIPGEGESGQERAERLGRQDELQEWQKVLDRAYGSIRTGHVAEAYQILRELVDEQNGSLEVYRWLYQNTRAWQDKTHALQISRRFIERLLQEGRQHEALEVFEQCRRASADYGLPEGQAGALAAYARSIGRHGLADELSVAAGKPR